MSGKTIVVTGGDGFVGRHLVEELRHKEPGTKVVVWDRSVEGLSGGVQGVEIDITEPGSYRSSLQKEQPAWIVHLAAVPSAALASQNEGYARRVNVEGTRQLLEEARRSSPGTRVLAVSSADIYGRGSVNPLPELSLDEAKPRNVYAETKWEMEQLIERDFNDLVIRVRPFPHIGPGQARGYVTADFASQIVALESKEVEEGARPAIKVGNLEARRDFTDVRDVVRAYRLLMQGGKLGEVYHVASGKAVSIKHILDGLLALSRVEVRVEQDKQLMRGSEVPVLAGSAAKLEEATGWRPMITLDQTLEDILDYWREMLVTSN